VLSAFRASLALRVARALTGRSLLPLGNHKRKADNLTSVKVSLAISPYRFVCLKDQRRKTDVRL
jgi:hypothetical protein